MTPEQINALAFPADSDFYPDNPTLEVGGYVITATIHSDEGLRLPWEEEDGHGPVTEWTRRAKRPGELVLTDSGPRLRRLYDFQEACKIARRDGWGVAGGRQDGESARAYAARAALADYDRLRRYCNGHWEYVGVAVSVTYQGHDLTGAYGAALWGIESDAGAYLLEVANDLIPEAMAQALSTAQNYRDTFGT